MKRQNFDDYEDVGGYIKNKNRDARLRDREKEMRHGGRPSRNEWLAANLEDEDDDFDISKIDIPLSRPEKPVKTTKVEKNDAPKTRPTLITNPVAPITEPSKKEFVLGPNSHTIKGKAIDFDRVAAIEKVENTYNNKLTYGIKFTFVGKKGLSHTAWFNQNIRERDASYESELAFWNSLKK